MSADLLSRLAFKADNWENIFKRHPAWQDDALIALLREAAARIKELEARLAPAPADEAVERELQWFRELLDYTDWVGTGSSRSGQLAQKEAEEHFTALCAAFAQKG